MKAERERRRLSTKLSSMESKRSAAEACDPGQMSVPWKACVSAMLARWQSRRLTDAVRLQYGVRGSGTRLFGRPSSDLKESLFAGQAW